MQKKCLPSSELATKEATQDLVLLNNYNNVSHFHSIMRLHTFPSYISASHISFTIDISNTCYAYYLEQDSCFYYCLVHSHKFISFCLRPVQSLRDQLHNYIACLREHPPSPPPPHPVVDVCTVVNIPGQH